MSLLFAMALEQYRELHDEFDLIRYATYETAVEVTNGAMLNRRAATRGVSDWDLFTHNNVFAMAYASEELIEHWAAHPRPTFAAFERQMVA